MPHFFVPPENIRDNQFRITGDEVHHLVRVRRVAVGTGLSLFDGTGMSYQARIDAIGKEEIRGTILSSQAAPGAAVAVHLFSAVPKSDRFDWLVEKAAELGVASVTPLVTARSVVKEISDAKMQRWRRLAQAACQQCGRSQLLTLNPPAAFSEAVERSRGSALALLPWEGEETLTVAEAFAAKSSPKDCAVIVGPEGGFTIAEVEQAKGASLVPVTLGRRILRVETAGILATILILSAAGDYGK